MKRKIIMQVINIKKGFGGLIGAIKNQYVNFKGQRAKNESRNIYKYNHYKVENSL